MNPKHALKEYADALTRAGLLTATTLTPAAENAVIDCLSYDTRSLHGTSLFLCKGAHFKAEYLSAALAQGAAAYVAEKPYPVDAPQLLVSDIRYAMVVLGQLFYDHVTDKLTSVGITGTKGKSTTAYYVRSILNDWLTSEGKPPCAILSSIDNYDGVITEESHITTPEVLELYQHFQNAYDSGISHLVMEVSSQALKVGRVRGMTFDVGAFLNIGTDHISPIEHPDFADYYASKLKLFDSCRVGCVNTDADHAAETVAHARSGGCELITFGVPEEFVRSGLRKARANGRMQVYESRDKRVTVIVDYAHNRMSFDALYRSTRVEYPGKEMISVFGCPGSHALQRRRDLGELSGENCAFVYITEEDSGEEPFAQIAADIEKHVKCPHLVCEDRAECIRRAILDHPEPHVILLTGKGEETTMKRGREFVPFPSDVELTLKYLAEYDEKEAKA